MICKRLTCWIVLVALGFVSGDTTTNIPENAPCKFKQFEGTCQQLYNCKMALEILKIRDHTTLRSMFCGFENNVPKVCCPKANKSNDKYSTTRRPQTVLTTRRPPILTTRFPEIIVEDYELKREEIVTEPPKFILSHDPSNLLPDRSVCGLITDDYRIYGGLVAALDEFPWIARIKFHMPTKDVDIYACAGSLISDRFVLTAAHCIGVYKVVSVRLGEWDSETEQDCLNDECSDPPVDVKVDKIILYPGYNRKNLFHADIALLRLERPVNFTDFVRPVCLPTTKYVARQDYIDSTYTTAGWGLTEFGQPSVIKRKVYLNSVPYATCRTAIPNLPDVNPPTVICAGGKKGEDACRGDSGGPLVRAVREEYQQNWYLFGITSYGLANCGSAGKPGVYTRVSTYMDWILETIAAG